MTFPLQLPMSRGMVRSRHKRRRHRSRGKARAPHGVREVSDVSRKTWWISWDFTGISWISDRILQDIYIYMGIELVRQVGEHKSKNYGLW